MGPLAKFAKARYDHGFDRGTSHETICIRRGRSARFGRVAGAGREAAANYVKLFSDVCMAKFGHLTTVWDWAESQNLLPITNPQALAVFAGRPNRDGKMISVAGGGVPGSGQAWAVRDFAGRFVLATRLDPEDLYRVGAESGPGRGRCSVCEAGGAGRRSRHRREAPR